MKIGVLISSIGSYGEKGFYNSQEIGLTKELDKLFDKVILYKLVSLEVKKNITLIENCKNSYIKIIPSKKIGINGFVDLKELDQDIDMLVYFADTQLSVPKVYRWTQNNNITFIPYIGAIESHSNNKLKKYIMNLLFLRNLNIYKKCTCLVKTPQVRVDLSKKGVRKIDITPVGLDLQLIKSDYKKYNIKDIKNKYGYLQKEKVILFIGRLVKEKEPLKMIDIFLDVYKKDKNYRLIIVGEGELREKIINKINKLEIKKQVKIINKISNSDIWELYRIADVFVNLNKHEIFGMAILEAMYYECKVLAWQAPGPNYIIVNNISGYLVNSNDEIIDNILNGKHTGKNAHKRVCDNFTWINMSMKIKSLIKKTNS